MALIEDFDNLAKYFFSQNGDSATENKTSVQYEIEVSDSDKDDIVVLPADALDSDTLIHTNIDESLIQEIEVMIDIDSGSDVLDVIIDEPPIPIDEPPLDGLIPLYGDINLEIYTDNGDNDIISGDTGDINFDDENTDYLA